MRACRLLARAAAATRTSTALPARQSFEHPPLFSAQRRRSLITSAIAPSLDLDRRRRGPPPSVPGRRPLVASAMAPPSSSLGRLDASETALFVCDVQERFRPLIAGFDAVAETSSRLVRGARALGVPAVVVTEQYPKALGPTVEEVASVLSDDGSTETRTTVVAKTDFSMMVPEVKAALPPNVKSVILCGIEAHVCVWQTVLDLRSEGVDVHVAVDGVSSQRLLDRELGLARAAQAGAFLCSSEMLLFQLTKGTSNPAFKAISALAKEERKAKALPGLGGGGAARL